jgi:peptide/nickel transport system permease protein
VLSKEELGPRLKEARFAIYRLKANPLSVLGIAIILSFVVIALLAPILASPNQPDPYKTPKVVSYQPLPPSQEHLFGTSGMPGYSDIYYGVIWGTRVSFMLAVVIVGLALSIGLTIGSVAGYLGGKIDEALMRGTDIFFALPSLLLAMVLISVIGRGTMVVVTALTIVWWPGFARLIRAEILRVKQSLFVEAARAMGISEYTILLKHVIPNAISPVLVLASLDMGRIVLSTAALGFLGVGFDPGTAEWGIIISEGRNWLLHGAWWITVFPGIAILAYVLGWNLLGDALRDILDPRTRRGMA